MTCSISATTLGWMPSVGSSRISSRGLVSSVRAMASCWRCPPDSRPARLPSSVVSAGNVSSTSSISDCTVETSCRFSSVVICGKQSWPCGT